MREMRRVDCQVSDPQTIADTMQNCQVCHLAFVDNGMPYVVPLNFGYSKEGDKLTLFFHSAKEGRKIDLVRAGGEVAFVMECREQMDTSEEFACKFTTHYMSVMGTGKARLVSEEDKLAAFHRIMAHYTTNVQLKYSPESLAKTQLFAVDVESISCKKH